MGSHTVRDNIFVEVGLHGQTCVQRLEEIWYQLYGENESILADRYNVIKQHLKDLLDEMVKEEEESLEENRRMLSDLMKCRQTLQDELSMTIEVPFEVDLMKPDICQQVQKLTAIVKEYEVIKLKRLQKLVEFKDTEERLCDILGEEPRYASISTVPPEELLTEIKSHLVTLEAEKVHRSDTCDSLASEIEELIHDVELDSVVAEGKLASLDCSDIAALSKSRIARLEEVKSELIALKEAQVTQIGAMKEKITLLWNLLDVSTAERNLVLQKTIKGFGQSVLTAWSQELERCETLKAVNMKSIITKLREVIKELWDECHIGEEERNKFTHFHSENYDEHSLEAHENEHKRLCDYKIEKKSVLDLGKKWFTLWDKMIMLENRANSNTNRYANRGGQLLKEERERKAVQKELPKVETMLQKSIAELEAKNGEPFLYDGRPLLELIAEHWEKRRVEKENEKESRKTQSRTPLKPNSAVHTPASNLMKRGKVLGAVENFSARKPVTARRELQMPMSAKKEVRRRSRSHDSKVPPHRDEVVNQAAGSLDAHDSTVGSYAGFRAFLDNACKSGLPLRSSTSPPATPSSRLNRSTECPFRFKSPKNVVQCKPKKFFASPSARRPMLH